MKKHSRSLLSVLLALCLMPAAPALAQSGADTLSLLVINVGKADSLLLRHGGSCYLIDAGTRESWGAVSAALRANGIDRLDGVPDEKRTARFVCVIAAAFPDGRVETRRGTIEGRIAYEPAGENGFGYDPIFYYPEKKMTTAQLSPEEKNKVSHRGKALRLIKEVL